MKIVFGGLKGKPLDYRFWVKVDKTSLDGCWMWRGYRKSKYGYGEIQVNGKGVGAHRVAWELANGRSVPEGLCVMHSCDTPGCVRPDHLVLGTVHDNHVDMARKGRVAHTTLTTGDVLHIRSTYVPYKNSAQLADHYGISQASVRDIVARRTWAHV